MDMSVVPYGCSVSIFYAMDLLWLRLVLPVIKECR